MLRFARSARHPPSGPEGAEALAAALTRVSLAPAYYVIAFDTEGAARSGGIREIAAVPVEDDAEQPFAEVVTQRGGGDGLSPEDAARTWAVVGPRFWAWVLRVTPPGRTPLLVAHNAARHDVPLLLSDTRAVGGTIPAGLCWADTLPAARGALPALTRHPLAVVYASLFGGTPPAHAAHSALGDARSLACIARDARVSERLKRAAAALSL